MVYTVSEIQDRIATVIDQSATAPASSTAEFAWRLKFINRAYQEWASAYDWEPLRNELFLSPAGATIALPADFRKMAMEPILYGNSSNPQGDSWPEINPEKRNQYLTTDQYFYILGNRENFNMIWSPSTLVSGASLLISYFSFPTLLSSPSQSVLIPDPEFLVERTIAHVLEARNDGRFQQAESKAREVLLQMVDNENNKGLSNYDPVQTTEEKMDFRFGRD